MLVLFEKMAMLLVLLAFGYYFARRGVVGPEFTKGLSKLVINFFLVGMILSSVINKDVNMTGREVASGMLLMILVLAISLGVGLLAPKLLGIKDGDKGMYSMLVAFMNNGFVGFPVVAAVYGEEAVFFASLSNIPFNILLYTVGVALLQSEPGKRKLRLKNAINAPVIATLIAVIIFAFDIKMPVFIDDIVDTVGAATVPLSMMCVGLSLGSVSLKEAVMQPRMYGLGLLRLVVCPLLTWFILHFFVTNPVILGTVVLLSATPSAVVCSILGIEYGRDGVESSEGVFISTMLSMITMPLLISLLGL